MYYIQELDNFNKIEELCNIIKISDEKIFIPIIENEIEKYSKRNNKLFYKTIKILKKKNTKNVIISKSMKNNQQLISILNSNNINIIDGRWLFKYMSYEVVEYVLRNKNMNKEQTEIAILTNELNDITIENIKLFAKEFKRVNIITNHITSFKKIEQKIYNEYGIMITVTNNKKKSLINSKIILNFDFPKELLNQYNIYDEAVIINLEGNMRIDKKRFNGINVNDYEIEMNRMEEIEYEKIRKYYIKQICETEINKKDNFKNIRNVIKRRGIKIKYLMGNNGILRNY